MPTITTKDRPIVLTASEVRAIMGGGKSQLRRVVSPRNSTVLGYRSRELWGHLLWDSQVPTPAWVDTGFADHDGTYRYSYLHVPARHPEDADGWEKQYQVRCLWEPGDRLWVKEAFYADTRESMDSANPAIIYVATPELAKEKMRTDVIRCTFLDLKPVARHEALANLAHHRFQRRRSPIFMPRWASRITLEVESVGVGGRWGWVVEARQIEA